MRGHLAPLLALALLLGCGGHGGSASSSSVPASSTVSVGKGKGRAVLKVKWPARTGARLIPNAANEITVNLLQGGTVFGVARIPRPTGGATSTSTTLTGLAYGDYSVWIEAFPNANGSGVAQAYGGGTMTVAEDVPGTLGVALESTVASLAIVPASPTVGSRGTLALAASALDAYGDVVLLSTGGGAEPIAWTSDAATVATVSGTGPTATLTGVAVGSANVTAALRIDDAGDVSTVTAPVSVPVATVTVSPSSPTVTYTRVYNPITKTYSYTHSPTLIAFKAALSPYLQGSTVSWSLSGGYGSLSSSGFYTPPGTPPTGLLPSVTVVATVKKNGASYTGTARVSL